MILRTELATIMVMWRSPKLVHGPIRRLFMAAVLGPCAAIVALFLCEPGLRTGMQALVWLAALIATKDLIWDFVIKGREGSKAGNDILTAGASFSVTYMVALMSIAA